MFIPRWTRTIHEIPRPKLEEGLIELIETYVVSSPPFRKRLGEGAKLDERKPSPQPSPKGRGSGDFKQFVVPKGFDSGISYSS